MKAIISLYRQFKAQSIAVTVLSVLFLVGLLMPNFAFFSNPDAYTNLHVVLELGSVVISAMVVALAWNLRHLDVNNRIMIIGWASAGVALVDLVHTMSFPGMPDFFTEASTQKAITFWLAGRIIAAVGFLALAAFPPQHWPQWWWFAGLAVVIGGALSAVWIGIYSTSWVPTFFVEGEGLTSTKRLLEYVLSATYALASVLLWRRAQRESNPELAWMAAAAWVLTLAELYFTLYLTVTDVYNLAGHLLKITAYVMIYRAIFVAGVQRPYQQLAHETEAIRRLEERMRQLALVDDLTGLPNRAALVEQADQLVNAPVAGPGSSAVILIDLDDFKSVNDVAGYDIGNKIIQETAIRLRQAAGPDVMLARITGDEFAALVAPCSLQKATELVQEFLVAVDKPFVMDDYDLSVTASIGIAMCPTDGKTFEALASQADAALAYAKQMGGNSHRFFSGDMLAEMSGRVETLSALRRAMDAQQFPLVYQPQVSLADGSITGIETLVRWNHPDRGLLTPDAFIDIAEHSGLILPLGEWIVNQALEDAASWWAGEPNPARLAVNLSGLQFLQNDLSEQIERALERAGLPASILEVEITETIAMGNVATSARTIARLHDLGVSVSIDDFGTGYSSLAYLKQFHIDQLKLDQAFVRDIGRSRNDEAIVEAIIDVAKALQCSIVAEGVESAEQVDFLAARGCDSAQGYYFFKPLPADEIGKLLLSRPFGTSAVGS